MKKTWTKYSMFLIIAIASISHAGGHKQLQLYSGPERPVSDVATVESLNLVFLEVDGNENLGDGKKKIASECLGTCKASILPGDHEFKVMVYMISGSGKNLSPKTVRFEAMKGHRYVLSGAEKNDGSKDGWSLKIRDMTPSLYKTPQDPLVNVPFHEK